MKLITKLALIVSVALTASWAIAAAPLSPIERLGMKMYMDSNFSR